jgi:hypothetical protein
LKEARMPEYKNVAVKPETYERFKAHGRYGESADAVMIRILNIADKAKEFAGEVEDLSREENEKGNGK